MVFLVSILAAGATISSLLSLVQASHDQQILSPIVTESLNDVRKALVKAEIIPNVIQDFKPEFFISVKWPSSKSANLGNVILPSDVDEEPAVFLYKDQPPSQSDDPADLKNPTFTLAMTDPDAPSHSDPKWSEFCHWIVTGVQFTAAAAGSESLSDIVPYRAPTPPPKTGFHRYVFVALLPQNGTDSKHLHLSKPSERKQWGTGKERHGVKDWARENGLVPVAANFIYVQNEDQ